MLILSVECYFKDELQLAHPVIASCILIALCLHFFSHISCVQSSFVLECMAHLVEVTLLSSMGIIAKDMKIVISCIPHDIWMALMYLELIPVTKGYICCPQCYKLHQEDTVLMECDYVEFPQTTMDVLVEGAASICGARLLGTRRRKCKNTSSTSLKPLKPLKCVVFQTLESWIVQLLASPHLCEILIQDLSLDPQLQTDIWDLPFLSKFCGPNGKKFYPPPAGSTHLIFTLNVDAFNPFHNKQAGKIALSTIILLCCLNLPAAIWYKKENMCVISIIPGPKSPSKGQINHVLNPLINELLCFWEPGIFFTWMHKCPNGMLVQAAVILLVCDLVSICQVTGQAPYSSNCNFCGYCYMSKDNIDDINDANWGLRTKEKHMDATYAWLNAGTMRERQRLYDQHGIRWSALNQLPYWDPIHMATVDSMHALFLGLLHHHICQVWGMDVSAKDGDG